MRFADIGEGGGGAQQNRNINIYVIAVRHALHILQSQQMEINILPKDMHGYFASKRISSPTYIHRGI